METIMTYPRLAVLIGRVLACIGAAMPLASGADKPGRPEVVAGLVMDMQRKSPKEVTSITVKLDGEEAPVKYLVDPDLNPKAMAVLAGVFPVGRVRLTYRVDGETPHLTGVEKVVGRASGIVIGQVLDTHGWWVEVKPKDGPPEGYACNYPKEKWTATEEQIKTLEKGDIVAIKFVTDGERHRIVQMEKRDKGK